MLQPNKLLLLTVTATGLLSSCNFDAGNTGFTANTLPGSDNAVPNPPPNVVGEDDRKNGYEVSKYQRALMWDFIVTFAERGDLNRNDDGVWEANFRRTLRNSTQRFEGFDPQTDQPLPVCSDVKFADEGRFGGCSGTLISENVVVTAGHCLPSPVGPTGPLSPAQWARELQNWCDDQHVVFGFMKRSPSFQGNTFGDNDIYGCSRVLTVVDRFAQDWAFIQLDRPAINHTPASVASVDNLPKVGEQTIAITHPKSLPMKYDDGGAVTEYLDGFRFRSTLDTFSGSSGGGIFNSKHRLIGIHVRSPGDFVRSSETINGNKRDCVRYNKLETSPENAATHTRIHAALEDFCIQHSHLAPRACKVPDAADACAPCKDSQDCGPGLSCGDYDLSGVGRCMIPCTMDVDCALGSYCSMETTGWCKPIETSRCLGTWGKLELDSCGIASEGGLSECPVDSQCIRGRCRYGFEGNDGGSCDDAIALSLEHRATRVHGSTRHGSETLNASCAGARGQTAVYSFELEKEELVHATVFGHDTVMMMRQECDANNKDVACDDDGLGDSVEKGSEISVSLPAGKHYLMVQSFNSKDSREGTPFQLDLRIVRPTPAG